MESRTLAFEGKWLRIYKTESGLEVYESRFLTDGLEVSADSIIGQFHLFNEGEQWEFATAYQAKPELTTYDERILSYLMGDVGKRIWMIIPGLLTRHSNREQVLAFLRNRFLDGEPKANYYQALRQMNAVELLPELLDQLKAMEERISSETTTTLDTVDYIVCLEAVATLTDNQQLMKRLKQFLYHSDPSVRFQAQQALKAS